MKIFESKREDVTGDSENYLKRSFVILLLTKMLRVNKSRKMKRAGYVTAAGDRIGTYRVLKGNLRERHYLEEVGVGGNLILKRILKK
jgi:hypothetical protein